jgi:hypothetical protein
MADPKKSPRDRYDVSENVEAQYVDPEQTVLVNKRGFTDLQTEQGQEAYIAAAKAAFKKDHDRMTDIIRSALERARRVG